MKNDNHIIASVSTIIAMILLFLLLWFVYLDRPYVPEEEGIEVAFGNADDGAGQVEEPAVEPSASPAPAPAPSAPSSNDLMTQENEESLALQREQERKRKERELAEAQLRKEQQAKAAAEAKARAEAEAAAKAAREAAERAAAEKAAAEQAKRDKAAQMGSLFANATQGSGSGDGSGSTAKGNPVGSTTGGSGAGTGSGTSGNGKWSLAGRSLKGNLAQPQANYNTEGTVVVAIRVNAAGQVTSATVGQGTNTSDQSLINAAIAAAKKAQFSAGDNDVVGSITYVFKLK